MNIIIRFFYATICFYVCALYMFASFDMIKNAFFLLLPMLVSMCVSMCVYQPDSVKTPCRSAILGPGPDRPLSSGLRLEA